MESHYGFDSLSSTMTKIYLVLSMQDSARNLSERKVLNETE